MSNFNFYHFPSSSSASKGHPFMERLRENRFLMYTIAASSAVVIALTFGLSQDLSNTFEIVEFPDEVSLFFIQMFHHQHPTFAFFLFFCFFHNQFQKILASVLIGDTVLAFAIDRICSFVFGSTRKPDPITDP